MNQLPHTEGPWRWEFNRKHRSMHLVGGRPQFDLTIMDFARWGMSGAVATLRDTSVDGMNVMHRLCDRPDWIAPFPGRAHHADWCASVIHPDMRLMAAAPKLLSALNAMLTQFGMDEDEENKPTFDQARAAVALVYEVPA